MSWSSDLMNRFRWGELFFKPIFWFPRLKFSLLVLICLHLKGRGPTADPEKWLSGIVHSAVIAESALTTVGTGLASWPVLRGLFHDSTSYAARAAAAGHLVVHQLWWASVEECNTLVANAHSRNAGRPHGDWSSCACTSLPLFFAYSSHSGFKQEIVFCRGSGLVN